MSCTSQEFNFWFPVIKTIQLFIYFYFIESKLSQAEPSRAEPSQAKLSQAKPSRAESNLSSIENANIAYCSKKTPGNSLNKTNHLT
jgi:hypothetical protein